MRPSKRPAPEVDPETPELKALLEQFSDAEIETGVLTRGAVAADSERHTAKSLEVLLGRAILERSLGRLMRSARANAGLSLADVAQRLGVTRSRVHQMEREGANLELHTVERYANALGYEVRVVFVTRGGEAPTREGVLDSSDAST